MNQHEIFYVDQESGVMIVRRADALALGIDLPSDGDIPFHGDIRAYKDLEEAAKIFEEVNRRLSASSSQGLTFRWEGQKLFIGSYVFAKVYQPCIKPGLPYAGKTKIGVSLKDTEAAAMKYCEEQAEVFIGMLQAVQP